MLLMDWFMVEVETRAGNKIWVNPKNIDTVHESKYGAENNPFIVISFAGSDHELHAKGTAMDFFKLVQSAILPTLDIQGDSEPALTNCLFCGLAIVKDMQELHVCSTRQSGAM